MRLAELYRSHSQEATTSRIGRRETATSRRDRVDGEDFRQMAARERLSIARKFFSAAARDLWSSLRGGLRKVDGLEAAAIVVAKPFQDKKDVFRAAQRPEWRKRLQQLQFLRRNTIGLLQVLVVEKSLPDVPATRWRD